MTLNRLIIFLICVNLAAIAGIFQFSRHVDDEVQTVSVEVETDMPHFIRKLIEHCQAPMSEARKAVLTNQLARITETAFLTRSHRESFVLLVCIESRFQPGAKSRAGAVGLTQVMPKYAAEFAGQCGLGKPSGDDLHDSEINLMIGACQFRKLLDSFDGNVGLALAAYNSGQFSITTKKAAALQMINLETANYLSRYLVLRGMTVTQ